MGGPGSTRWKGHVRKTTVEECLRLPITLFTRRGLVEASGCTTGSVEWNRAGHEKPIASVSFDVDSTGEWPVIWLVFRVEGPENAQTAWQRIGLESTPCTFGGERWWFQCPSPLEGIDCGGRRCGKLYVPPHASFFACRECYDLTYESRQQSNSTLSKV